MRIVDGYIPFDLYLRNNIFHVKKEKDKSLGLIELGPLIRQVEEKI